MCGAHHFATVVIERSHKWHDCRRNTLDYIAHNYNVDRQWWADQIQITLLVDYTESECHTNIRLHWSSLGVATKHGQLVSIIKHHRSESSFRKRLNQVFTVTWNPLGLPRSCDPLTGGVDQTIRPGNKVSVSSQISIIKLFKSVLMKER